MRCSVAEAKAEQGFPDRADVWKRFPGSGGGRTRAAEEDAPRTVWTN